MPRHSAPAVGSGPLQQDTDPGLIAQRGAQRAAGRARLAVRGPELTGGANWESSDLSSRGCRPSQRSQNSSALRSFRQEGSGTQHAAGREDDVDTVAGSQVQHRIAGGQPALRSGIAASERGVRCEIWKLIQLACP